MQFRIGDEIRLGGTGTKYHIQAPVSGLTAPAIRTGDGVWAGVDGGYVSSQLYGLRTIVISGFYIGKTCEEADDLRLSLMTKLRIRYLYPVFINTFSNKTYFTEAFITDVKADITNNISGEYQITLLCPDPIIYDGGDGINSDSAWMEQTFHKEQPGGFPIEYNSPVQWTAGQMASSIQNRGSIAVQPRIILRGVFTNPCITNVTTGRFVRIVRKTTPGDLIEIDMRNRIITLNGVSIAANRTIDSSWWDLNPGENRILLETDDDSDVDFGVIKYKQGFEGI